MRHLRFATTAVCALILGSCGASLPPPNGQAVCGKHEDALRYIEEARNEIISEKKYIETNKDNQEFSQRKKDMYKNYFSKYEILSRKWDGAVDRTVILLENGQPFSREAKFDFEIINRDARVIHDEFVVMDSTTKSGFLPQALVFLVNNGGKIFDLIDKFLSSSDMSAGERTMCVARFKQLKIN